MATIIDSKKTASFAVFTESKTVLGAFSTLAEAQARIETFYTETDSTEKCFIFGVTFDNVTLSK